MTRWAALLAGAGLIALAFVGASRVTDTREGQVYEVITLLAGGGGLGLLTYAFAARRRPNQPPPAARPAQQDASRQRSPRDLVLGAGGIVLAAVLLTGLAVSGGVMWAGFGFLLLLPMLAGSVYLCWRSLRPNP